MKDKCLKLIVGFCSLLVLLGACSTQPEPQPAPAAAVQKSPQQEYLSQVMRQISNFAYIPQLPVTSPKTGNVLLKLTISRDGQLLDIQMERSSGSGSLDDGVMEAARLASPYPPLPAEITGDRRTFLLPVSFRYLVRR